MNYTYTFEKLEVWQLSRSFVKELYEITKSFPKDEQYGLTSQIRRAAVSISSNIAEVSSRLTTKDKAHFTMIAFSSTMEVNQPIDHRM
ncbi:four helix bundle protein [Pedobacter helvus]|uniref:Four helix bundle protein n=1 Tax=Pedobacter helvus TaxID=2563444 RepID=A0ABW9JLQ6_9SPHI|nr:four helix bundle protein [Pedobacter ureilyticus]